MADYNAKIAMARAQKRFENGFVKPFLKDSKNVDKAIRSTALQLTRLIIQKTPVDLGRARAGWHPALGGLGGPAKGSFEGRTEGSLQLSKNLARIINRVPYIEALEFGSSKQAPAGMVRVSMKEMTTGSESLSNKLKDFYRKNFDIASLAVPPFRAMGI